MQIDRSSRPQNSMEIKFTPPLIQSFNLGNGLKIYFNEKNDLPIIRMNLIVNCGSKFDGLDKKGLSNLLAMCIDEGAGSYDALHLADEFDVLGANFNVSCDNDICIISLQVLSENFSAAINLIRDVVMTPHFREEDFNRERHKILTKLHQAKSEPDYIADISFDYLLFGKHSQYAYPSVGIESTIPNIQNDSIRTMYKKAFVPSNASLVIVGDLKRESLVNELASVFGEWDGANFQMNSSLSQNKSKRKLYLINKTNASQTEIRTGHLSSVRNEKDFYPKQIVNLILGGQFSSRLNINLREKNGYTYGVHSRFNYLMEAGYFAVSTSVDVQNTINALNEIYSELEKIRDGISQDELNFAKSSLTKKYPLNFETYRQIAANISAKVMHKLPDDYFDTYIGKVNTLSLKDVNSIAASSIHHEKLVTVLVGDSKKILSLRKENELEEIEVLEFDEVFNK